MGVEKYSYETKIEVVKYAIETKSSIVELSKTFRIPKTLIERWLNLYRFHGEKGLVSRNEAPRGRDREVSIAGYGNHAARLRGIEPVPNKKENFSGHFKIEVLKYMKDYELSYTKTATHFCLDAATVSKWEKYLLSPSEKSSNAMKKPTKSKKREQSRKFKTS